MVNHFIVEVDLIPIGFCQYYEYKNSGETWHGQISLEGTYSVDYLIGDKEYLGKGYGKRIILGLTEMIRKLPDAKRVIALPDLENIPSCKTFESCGYSFNKEDGYYFIEF